MHVKMGTFRFNVTATGLTFKFSSLNCNSDPLWNYNHEEDIRSLVIACRWISHEHLAVCMEGCVKVYQVSSVGSHHKYTVISQEWSGKEVRGVAVSESLPGEMLVICEDRPYVYQHPCHEVNEEGKKNRIRGDEVDPYSLAANATCAVVDISIVRTVICSLPDFNNQTKVQISLSPYDLSITSDYLQVMSKEKIVVKALGDVNRDLVEISAPDGWEFASMSCRENAKEIFAACNQEGKKSRVNKYVWDGGEGNSQFVNSGTVVDGLGHIGHMRLAVTSEGLLAVGRLSKVYVYSWS